MSKEKQKTREIEDYRERLIKQKTFLNEVLSKVEKQILALEVERLHLKNTLLGSAHSSKTALPNKPPLESNKLVNKQDNSNSQTHQKLNLTVPTVNNDCEEETEDDELNFLDDIEI